MGRVRVLVVDDSALMRKLIAAMLKSADEVEVVGSARDAAEAVALAAQLRPDVITLDVEMPGRSGLEALPDLLDVCPVPIIMVSSLTTEGAEVTLAALELGAVDFLPKPGGARGIAELKACSDLLISKVLVATQSRVRRHRASSSRAPATATASSPATAHPAPRAAAGSGSSGCVVIGISTGGPQALCQVLPELTPPIPPIVIVQHMPAQFTGTFAARLGRLCGVEVKEAEDGDKVLPDRILVAPGGRHLVLIGLAPNVRASLTDGPPVSGHRPSIDMLFQSAARCYGPKATGFLMTGMGRDGVEGCRRILAAGGRTFGQDEATSVVYGMNKVALQEGAIQREFALHELPGLIQALEKSAGSA